MDTKNDHFRAMLTQSEERGFPLEGVVFESWFGSWENLDSYRSYHWIWLTRLKRNRQVNPDGAGNRPLS